RTPTDRLPPLSGCCVTERVRAISIPPGSTSTNHSRLGRAVAAEPSHPRGKLATERGAFGSIHLLLHLGCRPFVLHWLSLGRKKSLTGAIKKPTPFHPHPGANLALSPFVC
ncbi:unnamed protein product, partial [Ectocarpus sp. 8 AP-2014]